MRDKEEPRRVLLPHGQGREDGLARPRRRDDHGAPLARLAALGNILQRHLLHRVGQDFLPGARLVAIKDDGPPASPLVPGDPLLRQPHAPVTLLVDGPSQLVCHVTVACGGELEVPLLVLSQRRVSEVGASHNRRGHALSVLKHVPFGVTTLFIVVDVDVYAPNSQELAQRLRLVEIEVTRCDDGVRCPRFTRPASSLHQRLLEGSDTAGVDKSDGKVEACARLEFAAQHLEHGVTIVFHQHGVER